MTQPLEALVHFEKSVYKLTKKQFKSLAKDAKKARKKEDRELADSEARERLGETLELLTQFFDTAASREAAEADARADVVVDGEVLIERAPARVLVAVAKQLRRLSKTTQELAALHPDADYDQLAERTATLEAAVQTALAEANQTLAPERKIGEALVEYVTGA
jgi:hypothetical protein